MMQVVVLSCSARVQTHSLTSILPQQTRHSWYLTSHQSRAVSSSPPAAAEEEGEGEEEEGEEEEGKEEGGTAAVPVEGLVLRMPVFLIIFFLNGDSKVPPGRPGC
jgi:hypothetical protein